MKRYEGSGAGEIGMTLEGASSLDRSVEMWVRVNMERFQWRVELAGGNNWLWRSLRHRQVPGQKSRI